MKPPGSQPRTRSSAAEVQGLVLCGGRSRRFGGGDKALAELNGRTLLSRAVGALAGWVRGPLWLGTGAGTRPELLPHAEQVWIAERLAGAERTAAQRFSTEGPPCDRTTQVVEVLDRPAGVGPLGGLHAGRAAARAASATGDGGLVVLSCDLPAIDGEFLQELLERTRAAGSWVGLPRTPEGVHPLAAVYHLGCLPAVAASLAAGERRVVAFHARLETELEGPVPAVHEWILDPEHLTRVANVNTSAEFVSWRDRPAPGTRPDGPDPEQP